MNNERNVRPRIEGGNILITTRDLDSRRVDKEFPIEDMYISLLSICNDLPEVIKIHLSMGKKNIKSRIKQIEYYEKDIINSPIDELRKWVQKEQMVRTSMRRLVCLWLQRKYGKRILNNEDPCTLMTPIKLVRFFDIKSRGVYQFEASSLKKQFDISLTYSSWMFPEPKHPKNPLTNIDFNEGQRITIINSLRNYGYTSMLIEAYKLAQWNIIHFRNDNYTQLKYHAINNICNNVGPETAELLSEFIELQYTENQKNDNNILHALNWAIKNKLDDSYMKTWINLMKKYYTIKARFMIQDNDVEHIKLNIIYVLSMQLFDNPIINTYNTLRLSEQNIESSMSSEESSDNLSVIFPRIPEIYRFNFVLGNPNGDVIGLVTLNNLFQEFTSQLPTETLDDPLSTFINSIPHNGVIYNRILDFIGPLEPNSS